MTATAPSLVFGPRKELVKLWIWFRILRLALRYCGTPSGAARATARVVRDRHRRRGAGATTKYVAAGGRYFCGLYTPGWPSLAFDRFVAGELARLLPGNGGPRALNALIFAITRKCPLRCDHCCEGDRLNAPDDLSLSELRAIARAFHERGASQIFLSGGEPLQRFDDLVDLVRSASDGTDVWLLSSGYGLTAERSARLRAAGLTGVAVSLDHWDPQAHDRFRGLAGAYRQVEEAVRNAGSAGLLTCLSLCATRAFVSEPNLERYAETARRLGAAFIQILEPRPAGRYAGRDVTLPAEQLSLLERFCHRLNFDPSWRHLPAASYLSWFERRTEPYCGANRLVYVDASGAVHPCPFCRAPAGGVLDGGLDAALAAMSVRGCAAVMDRRLEPGPRVLDGGAP